MVVESMRDGSDMCRVGFRQRLAAELASMADLRLCSGSASGRFRVRGKDCVRLSRCHTRSFDELFSARVADTGRRLTRMRSHERSFIVSSRETRSHPHAARQTRSRSSSNGRRRNCCRRIVAGDSDAVAEVDAHYQGADRATLRAARRSARARAFLRLRQLAETEGVRRRRNGPRTLRRRARW